MRFTEFRLKLIHFIRKYKKIIFIIISIWAIVFLVNYMLKNRKIIVKPSTTYEPHISIMKDSSTTPKTLREPIEEMIEEYIECCNDGNYQTAFNMLTEECRKYEFNDNVENFMQHVLTKMPTPKKYSIQSYSNISVDSKNLYIYEIKYIDDFLATGLTNSEYTFTSEKMSFFKENDGSIKMMIGSYIYHSNIQSISENEYLKIDIIDKKVNYGAELYQVKFTNRSEYTVVIADGFGTNEVALQLSQEVRNREEPIKIILKPGESLTQNLEFSKFVDDGDTSQSILFGTVRVLEEYSGNDEEEIGQNEINNAIAKFSMSISV